MEPELWLKIFRKTKGPVSGEYLSRKRNVSRTAIWKQIQALRSLGYLIEGERAKGYRLVGTPDIPYSWELEPILQTKVIGRKIQYFAKLASTNRTAYEEAEKDAPEGTVIIANEQTEGRGRRGKSWYSPAGKNIYTSILLRPRLDPSKAPQLTLVAGVAAAEAIKKSVHIDVGLKWPNDLWFQGKKLGGILTELSSELDEINFVILGIGIDVNTLRFPKELRKVATSLQRITGKRVSRIETLKSLYEALDKWYSLYLKEGFEPIRRAWEQRSVLKQTPVTIDFLDRSVEGIAIGLDDSGGLRIQKRDGHSETILSGDVHVKVEK